MATLRDIRSRIGGIKNTQKITKAMKMVAAAKLRRAQEAVVAARPYARSMKELLLDLSSTADVSANPLFTGRPGNGRCLIVVTSDRGLCGAFNSNIVKAALLQIQEAEKGDPSSSVSIVCIGKKGVDFFGKRGYNIAGKHVGVYAGLNFATARTIVDETVGKYVAGQYDRVDIVYNEFQSVMRQRLSIVQFLPIRVDSPTVKKSDPAHSTPVDYIYEPSQDAILKTLVPKYLNVEMWRILLESNAAEQGARMTAMDNATTNAADLLRGLQLSYNKARQASITKELLEIVSGAEALKKAG